MSITATSGFSLRISVEGTSAIVSLSREGKLRSALYRLDQPLTKYGMVVCDQHASARLALMLVSLNRGPSAPPNGVKSSRSM